MDNKEFFAEHVHRYIVYRDIESALQKYERRILNELRFRGLENDFFKDKTVIDIGTGFQALTVAKMGARQVYHLDQSAAQIAWMHAYCAESGISNIVSVECDITREIPIDAKADTVLVFGIWHHLENGNAFMRNLCPLLNEKEAQIWMRVYRSGSWSRWLVGHLRKLTGHLDPRTVRQTLEARFAGHGIGQWIGDLLDDFFAPVWKAFHPDQFAIEGVSRFVDYEGWDYNFNEKDENFRVDFHITPQNRADFENFVFPATGVDQYTLPVGQNEFPASEALKRFTRDFGNGSAYLLGERLITLYELVRAKPPFDPYTRKHAPAERCGTASKRLEGLTEILESFEKDA